jgi:histone-lysine N-methyltransferase SETMAR
MPEMKEESKQWTSPGKQAPKKAKTVPSARKVMATISWDSKGIIFIDYLKKGRTITGQYYDQLWGKFDDALKEKWPHLAKKKVLFHQVNAPAHRSLVAAANMVELGCKLLSHPPYFPDLAPCDFFLFPNTKKWVGEKRFASNEEVITETEFSRV